VAFLLSLYEMSFWNVDESQKRSFNPSSYNLASLFLWPAQGILYSYSCPYNTLRWLYYSYFPQKDTYDYFKLITQTSAILFVREMGPDLFQLSMKQKNWLYNNKLVDVLIEFDRRSIQKFLIDDTPVAVDDYMGALWLVISTMVHPMIHSYVNTNQVENDGHLGLFNVQSQFLNSLAAKYGAACYGGPITVDIFKRCVDHNCSQEVPVGHTVNHTHSQHFEKIFKCRRILFCHFRKYKLGNDFESYFLCGFMHSIDHYFLYKHFGQSSMYFNGWNVGFNMYHYVKPRLIPFFNTSLRTLRWYDSKWDELYGKLKSVDEEIADNVMLSLCQ